MPTGTTVILEPDTDYWVRIDKGDETGCDFTLDRTTKDDQDGAGKDDWSIANDLSYSTNRGANWFSSPDPLRIRVEGTPLPALQSATVNSAGTQIDLVFDKNLFTEFPEHIHVGGHRRRS